MSEDEILQISNDISEDMLSPKVTKKQLVEVIEFFRREAANNHTKLAMLKTEFALFWLKNCTNASEPSPNVAPKS